MCQFKSAIYLASGKILWLKNEDSHEKILAAHKIEDKDLPADFVKIECVPQENPKDIFNWKFIVDMSDDELPDWWNDGHAKTAEKAIRDIVAENYIFIDKTLAEVDSNGYFYDCKIGSIAGGEQWLRDTSTIETVSGGEQLLHDNSTIGTVSGGRQELWGNSTIETVSGGEQWLHDNSKIIKKEE